MRQYKLGLNNILYSFSIQEVNYILLLLPSVLCLLLSTRTPLSRTQGPFGICSIPRAIAKCTYLRYRKFTLVSKLSPGYNNICLKIKKDTEN